MAMGDELLDSIIDGFRIDPSDEAVAQAIHYEIQATNVFEVLARSEPPQRPTMFRSLARALAERRSAPADRVLAALAAAGSGPAGDDIDGAEAFNRAWQRRRNESSDALAQGIGEFRTVRAFTVSHVMGDGVNLMVEVDSALGPYTIGMYVDHNLNGMAKDLLIGPRAEDVEATFQPDDGFVLHDISLGEAAWRFGTALERTARTINPPISGDFTDLLPFVAGRFYAAMAVEPRSLFDPDGDPIAHVEVTRAEVLAHLGAFKASPEFAAIPGALADDAFEVVELWIDHAVNYTIGKVRRVSPVLVEIFCTSWFPRKVMADEEMVTAAPIGIAAWLQFCARTTGLDERWLDEALDSLHRFAPDLGQALDEPDTDEFQMTEPLFLPHDLVWKPVQEIDDPGNIHLEVDTSDVPPSRYVATKVISMQASIQAASLLGPAFANPAAEIAVAIGGADPCLFDHTQWGSWPGAIVWLLAEDNDLFAPRTVGRRRDDLADALPMTRATYQSKVKKVREALGVRKGTFRVTW